MLKKTKYDHKRIYFFIICFSLKIKNTTINNVKAILISVGNEAVAVDPNLVRVNALSEKSLEDWTFIGEFFPRFLNFVRLKIPSEKILED